MTEEEIKIAEMKLENLYSQIPDRILGAVKRIVELELLLEVECNQ